MRIHLTSNDGAGYAGWKDVRDGLTIGELFRQEFSGKDASAYHIRLDGERPSSDAVLTEGQHVSVTPMNVKGG